MLAILLNPLFKPNIKKTFNITTIDEALTVKPAKYEFKEKVENGPVEDIIFDDEIEDERIRHNYIFIMNNLIMLLDKENEITLGEFNTFISETYDNAILKNADYYSFFVNFCQVLQSYGKHFVWKKFFCQK